MTRDLAKTPKTVHHRTSPADERKHPGRVLSRSIVTFLQAGYGAFHSGPL
jgi:hypothetical protein